MKTLKERKDFFGDRETIDLQITGILDGLLSIKYDLRDGDISENETIMLLDELFKEIINLQLSTRTNKKCSTGYEKWDEDAWFKNGEMKYYIEGCELEKAAKELYFAGVWRCEELNEKQQEELWENLRDILEIPKRTKV